MRISSSDGKTWIEIRRNEGDDFPSFAFSGAVNIGHGRFTGRSTSLTFLNLSEFAEALDAFILQRDLQPCLEGTYGSYARVWQPRSKNEVMLGFCIGDAFSGWVGTSEFKLQGEFPIEQEILNSLVFAFRSMVRDA
ncbi:hypothetical protein [Methylocaldum szegediense]|uniref:hypothetical protein n=1 Tax=Methylocaldum szegediense TaxID=73780 RepID=UPI00047E81D3|nr:hypothetical protein [Methylocaldum szegediense]